MRALKLSDDAVRQMGRDRDAGVSYRQLARRYGVSVFAAHYAIHVRLPRLVPALTIAEAFRAWR